MNVLLFLSACIFVSTSAVTVGKFLAISRRSVPVLMSHSSRGLSLNTTTRYCLRRNSTNTYIQSQNIHHLWFLLAVELKKDHSQELQPCGLTV